MGNSKTSNTLCLGEQHKPFCLVLFLVAFGLSLWATPAAAKIISIDPAQPPSPLLGAADMAKLAALQNTKELFIFSEVSPDDSTLVMAAAAIGGATGSEPEPPQPAFLNLINGTMQPIDPLFGRLSPQSNVVWRDAQTALYLARNDQGEPQLVTLDRASGKVQPSALPVAGAPLSLAPNGARLLVEVPTGEQVTLTAVDLATKATEALLVYPQGGSPAQIAWSPDGSKLALVRLTLQPELGADQAQLMALATQDVLGQLPLNQNPFFQGMVVDRFDLARHDFHPAALTAADGDGAMFQQMRWSSDGQTLLVKMVRPSQPAGRAYPTTFYQDRAYYRFYDANLKLLGKLDRPEISAPLTSSALFIAPDEVIFVANEGITYRLFYYNRLSGEFRPLPVAEGSFAEAPQGYQVLATHRTRQLVFTQSSFQRPPEIYRIGLADTQAQPLTHFNDAVAALNQIRVDKVTFPLKAEDHGEEKAQGTRTGYLLQPAGATFPPHHAPIVLYQQGGPGGAMTNRWGATTEDPFNLLPNFGIAVLVMPFVGREGFGPDFFNALVDAQQFGVGDIDEAAQAVQYMVAQGYATRHQVGITGCSYGGYFTSQSITRYPQLYAAANAQCTPPDLKQWWSSETGRLLVSYAEGQLPTANPAEYRQDSPLAQASNVRTPLLLFHGADDFLPISLAQRFHDQVAATGTPVALLTFQQEGHGLANPVNKAVAAQWQIAWFRRYLAPQSR